ncbi:MAG: hypothetical protein E6F96_04105 [Actinobacteria bacterium]|nr:MAG: hypothetical protein E6F96_04105 [Actinomycetota bacterium]
MRIGDLVLSLPRGVPALPATAAAGALALCAAAPGQSGAGPALPSTATLEQCVTSVEQLERSATFAGEMSAIPGTLRMAIRIDVQERVPGRAGFHTVTAPGLGVWRMSDPKVKIYKYLKQVTNLSAPAVYRALVRFRWESARGHMLRRAEHVTPRCEEPAAPPVPPPAA